MKAEKRVRIPQIDMYRFAFYYSPDGEFGDSCLSQRGLYLEVRNSKSKRAYLEADMRPYGVLESLRPDTAKNLRRIIHDWKKHPLNGNGGNGKPLKIQCGREKTKEFDGGLEFKQYRRLSPREREMIEKSLNVCREYEDPEIKLVFQKNGKEPAAATKQSSRRI